MTTIADVLSQMFEAGMPETPERLDVCGKIRRFGKKKRGWYRLWEHISRNGNAYITGAFGYWGIVDGQRVVPAHDTDPEELARLREAIAARQARDEEQRAQLAARASMRSLERWRAASRTGSSAYLDRKGVHDPESIRFEPDGTILVPMVRYDLPREQALVGVQSIAVDGEKRFARGTAKRASACQIGHIVVGDPILVGEGYATCMTLRAACGRRLPVFVAFDAGNLEPVVAILRAKHPQCPILVCADDDHATDGNPGRTKAKKTMKEHGAHMIYPVWPGARGPKDTDFNDLARAEGVALVSRQLEPALKGLGFAACVRAELRDVA